MSKPNAGMTLDQAADWFANDAEPQDFTSHDEDKAITALAAAHLARLEAEQRINEAVQNARENGATWDAIGQAVGMSRQGAYQKYAKAR